MSLNVDGAEYTSFDDASECEQRMTATAGELLGASCSVEFDIGAGEAVEEVTDSGGRLAGRLIRRWGALDGSIVLHADRVAGAYQALRLRVLLENTSAPPAEPARRDDGLRYAMIAAHSLIGAPGGSFLSMTDPPEWAAATVAACRNVGTWPVLAGPDDCRELMLSSPVILYDHPEITEQPKGGER